MTSFCNMANDLIRAPVAAMVEDVPVKSETRTGAIRAALKRSGRTMTAAEIAYDVDLPSFDTSLVFLLLKHDIAKGRVLVPERGKYRWNFDWDTADAAAVRAAIKLLQRAGYQFDDKTVYARGEI